MTVVASAPGKVLLAGGFLVLDRKHRGLVFGLDARIHVAVAVTSTESSTSQSQTEIIVKSPQFQDAEWAYTASKRDRNRGINITQIPK